MARILTNQKALPEPIFAALMNDKYVKRGDISITSLIDSPKPQIIKSKVDYYEDVENMTWALLGTAMHVVLERAVEKMDEYSVANNLPKRYRSEFQMEVPCNGWTVTGTVDLLQANPKIMWDYKNCSVWKIIKAKKDVCRWTNAVIYRAVEGEHDSWIKQLNCYYTMLKKFYNFECEALRIVVIAKDWKEAEYMSDTTGDYPSSPWAIIELPLYDAESTWKYMEGRVNYHKSCKAIADSQGIDAVPECTPEERWQRNEIWKFYKEETAKRSNRNYEIKDKTSFDEAVVFWNSVQPLGWTRKIFKGQNVRCERYCPVNVHCNFFKSLRNK